MAKRQPVQKSKDAKILKSNFSLTDKLDSDIGPRPDGAFLSGEVALYSGGEKRIITPAKWVMP